MTAGNDAGNWLMDLLDGCPTGVLIFDRRGQISATNRALTGMLGMGPGELLGKTSTGLPPGIGAIATCSGGSTIRLTGADGAERFLQCTVHSLDKHASTMAEIRYFVDVTEYEHLRRERDRLTIALGEIAPRDRLTGLLNRSALLEALESQVTRSRRYGNALSVVGISLRPVAEGTSATSSGAVDDAGLVRIAQMLRDQLRWADLVARTDPQRFLLVLPETNAGAAEKLTGMLHGRLAEIRACDTNGEAVSLDACFGIAQWVKGDDAKRLLQRANVLLDDEEASNASGALLAQFSNHEAR